MDEAPKTNRFNRGRVILLAVVVCVAVMAAVLALRSANRSSTPAAVPQTLVAPPALVIPAYAVRPGPKGTNLASETVDLLTLALPDTWKIPAPTALTLPRVLAAFAAQDPSLAPALHAQKLVEDKAAIRLFAYQPAAPAAFVSVLSFAAPGTKPFTAAGLAATVALAKTKSSIVAVSASRLPVGEVLVLNSSETVAGQPVVIEVIIVVSGGRIIEIDMVSDTTGAAVPAVFDQIAQSLRIS